MFLICDSNFVRKTIYQTRIKNNERLLLGFNIKMIQLFDNTFV